MKRPALSDIPQHFAFVALAPARVDGDNDFTASRFLHVLLHLRQDLMPQRPFRRYGSEIDPNRALGSRPACGA